MSTDGLIECSHEHCDEPAAWTDEPPRNSACSNWWWCDRHMREHPVEKGWERIEYGGNTPILARMLAEERASRPAQPAPGTAASGSRAAVVAWLRKEVADIRSKHITLGETVHGGPLDGASVYNLNAFLWRYLKVRAAAVDAEVDEPAPVTGEPEGTACNHTPLLDYARGREDERAAVLARLASGRTSGGETITSARHATEVIRRGDHISDQAQRSGGDR